MYYNRGRSIVKDLCFKLFRLYAKVYADYVGIFPEKYFQMDGKNVIQINK